jgi:hypothetical protein
MPSTGSQSLSRSLVFLSSSKVPSSVIPWSKTCFQCRHDDGQGQRWPTRLNHAQTTICYNQRYFSAVSAVRIGGQVAVETPDSLPGERGKPVGETGDGQLVRDAVSHTVVDLIASNPSNPSPEVTKQGLDNASKISLTYQSWPLRLKFESIKARNALHPKTYFRILRVRRFVKADSNPSKQKITTVGKNKSKTKRRQRSMPVKIERPRMALRFVEQRWTFPNISSKGDRILSSSQAILSSARKTTDKIAEKLSNLLETSVVRDEEYSSLSKKRATHLNEGAEGPKRIPFDEKQLFKSHKYDLVFRARDVKERSKSHFWIFTEFTLIIFSY